MSLPEVILIVSVDVEEDDWGYYCQKPTVENIKMIPSIQKIFDSYGVKPSYLVNYPVVSCDWAVEILSAIDSAGKCEIGTHLHPWNTPPLNEHVNERNSMMKNLPYDLQVAKLRVLTDKIDGAFGIRPRSFRAGRWGLGSETVKALISCGYRIDSSVTPTMSWSNDGDGPEYLDVRMEPYWLSVDNDVKNRDDNNSILEVPVSIGFNRQPFEFWQRVSLQLQKKWLKFLHPFGILNHTGLLRKIWLSPEVSSAEDMITLSKLMINNGNRFLNLMVHSNVLLPGKTPFVKDKDDLEVFYSRIEKYLEYLTSSTKFTSLTLTEVRKLFENVERDR